MWVHNEHIVFRDSLFLLETIKKKDWTLDNNNIDIGTGRARTSVAGPSEASRVVLVSHQYTVSAVRTTHSTRNNETLTSVVGSEEVGGPGGAITRRHRVAYYYSRVVRASVFWTMNTTRRERRRKPVREQQPKKREVRRGSR